jgi:hypothetical protein
MHSEDFESVLKNRRVLLVADFDSFIKSAFGFAEPLKEHGAVVTPRLAATVRGQLSAHQAEKLGLGPRPVRKPLPAIVDEAFDGDFDVILLSLDGSRTRRFLHFYGKRARREGTGRRPLIVTGYPGIVFRMHLNGFMDRAPVDLFCMTSKVDHDLYTTAVGALGADPSNAIVTGLSITWRMGAPVADDPAIVRDAIVYFDQPTVPVSFTQRSFVVDQLIALARRFPDTQVLLKPRHRPDELTIHWTKYHLADIAAARRDVPANFRVVYDSVDALLKRTKVALTFSSTAAIEAMRAGIPTRILSDLGVSETTGVSFYVGSGALASIADIRPDMPVAVRPEWLEEVAGVAHGEAVFLKALCGLLRRRDEAGGYLPLRALSPFIGSRAWHDYATTTFGELAAIAPGKGGLKPLLLALPKSGLRLLKRMATG